MATTGHGAGTPHRCGCAGHSPVLPRRRLLRRGAGCCQAPSRSAAGCRQIHTAPSVRLSTRQRAQGYRGVMQLRAPLAFFVTGR